MHPFALPLEKMSVSFSYQQNIRMWHVGWSPEFCTRLDAVVCKWLDIYTLYILSHDVSDESAGHIHGWKKEGFFVHKVK